MGTDTLPADPASLIERIDPDAIRERRIEPGLRVALRDRPSLELRRRIETLLLQVNEHKPEAEVLRRCRAIHILECLDSSPARDLLETLARGAAGGFTTEEAKSALKRVAKNRIGTCDFATSSTCGLKVHRRA